uniref:Nuclear protein MDM1 n=1 Tax=Dicentrarchus labrax TaxID=13489 RepID=A0A8P4JZS0_DICLA
VRLNTRRATGFPGPEVCLLGAARHWPASAPTRWVSAENPVSSVGRGSVLVVSLSPAARCSFHQIPGAPSLSRLLAHTEQRHLLPLGAAQPTGRSQNLQHLLEHEQTLDPLHSLKLQQDHDLLQTQDLLQDHDLLQTQDLEQDHDLLQTQDLEQDHDLLQTQDLEGHDLLDPGPRTGPRPAADPGPRTGPRPAADPRPSARPRTTADSGSVEPGAAGKSAKPRPSKLDSQPQPSRPLTSAPDGQQPSADEVQHALRWRAGLRSGGRRSGSQQSEYHRQFSWKKPQAAASPMLTAEQLLHSSSRSVPPFKTNPVPVETEYRRSFQGLAPPSEPRLRKHLEHQRVPLFHAYMANKKRREESEKKLHPRPDDATPPPPPQVQRGHRILEEGGAPDGEALQVKELRQKVSLYRHRGWGANFSRGHLSQLVSEHNALWEPTDTTDSTSDPPSPRLTSDLCPDPDSRSTSHVEALDLASRSSNSSRRSSAAAVVVGSGETHNVNKNKQIKAQTPQSPPAERLTAWGEEEEEEEHTDE